VVIAHGLSSRVGELASLGRAMLPLEHMSRRAIICLSLLVCFAPFCWVPFVSENRWLWVKLWPILHGTIIIGLFRAWLTHFDIEMAVWLQRLLAIVISLVIPAAVLFLMFRIPRWRFVVAAIALIISCFIRLATYGAYKA